MVRHRPCHVSRSLLPEEGASPSPGTGVRKDWNGFAMTRNAFGANWNRATEAEGFVSDWLRDGKTAGLQSMTQRRRRTGIAISVLTIAKLATTRLTR